VYQSLAIAASHTMHRDSSHAYLDSMGFHLSIVFEDESSVSQEVVFKRLDLSLEHNKRGAYSTTIACIHTHTYQQATPLACRSCLRPRYGHPVAKERNQTVLGRVASRRQRCHSSPYLSWYIRFTIRARMHERTSELSREIDMGVYTQFLVLSVERIATMKALE